MATRVTNAQILTALTASEARRDEQLAALHDEVRAMQEAMRAMNGRVREHSTTIARHDERLGAVEGCTETLKRKVDNLDISTAKLSVLIGGGAGLGGIIGAVLVWATKMAQIAMAGGP